MPSAPTKRTLIAIAVLVFVGALGTIWFFHSSYSPSRSSSTGTAPEIVNLLPDAPVIAYINVASLRKLQGSMVAAILGLAGPSPTEDRDYQNFVRATGFDYSRDLDHAAIAFWPGTINQTLVIADGRFDRAKIEAYALQTGHKITSGSHSFISVPGDPPVAFEFLSPTRIEMASGPSAESPFSGLATDVRNSEMRARILRVAAAPIFAAVRTDNLPPSFYAELRSTPQFEHLAHAIRGITFAGQPDGNLIHLALDAECDSVGNTLELSTVIEGIRVLGPLALADPKTRSKMTKEQVAFLGALLNQVKVSHQDRWVRLTLDLTPEMLGQPAPSPNAQLRVPAPRN
jgi:hypothetical protein